MTSQVTIQKRKLIEQELGSLKSKRKRCSAEQASSEKLAKKYSADAEEGKLELISAANAIWEKAEQKKKTKLFELGTQIEKKNKLKSV